MGETAFWTDDWVTEEERASPIEQKPIQPPSELDPYTYFPPFDEKAKPTLTQGEDDYGVQNFLPTMAYPRT